jgi:sugar lactone lactonase YvrE
MKRRTLLTAAAPAILTAANKSGAKRPILGSGEYTYEAIHDWGELPAGLRFGNTHGVVEDSQGRIYIAHTLHASSERQDTLVVFDDKGKYIRSWGAEFKGGAHGLHLRKEGRQEFLYFVDTGKGRPTGGISAKHACMIKMTLEGEEVLRIGYPKEAPGYKPDGSTKFSPTNVAIAPNGDIYVADGYGAYFINQYDARGKFLRSFGGNGKEAGQLACPHGLIVDTRGAEPYLLVADRTNNRLQRFTLDGRHLGFGAGVNLPCHLHARKGVAVVPDLAARLTLLDHDNQVIAHLGEDTTGDWQELRKKPRSEFRAGKFVSPHGACFDHAGNIFVAEWVEVGRVTKLRRV